MPLNKRPSPDTLAALEKAPNMYLVLSPELYILTASDLYLEATMTTREAIQGKHIFEAFPDNPDFPDADGVQNINASLQTVLRTKKPDRMPVQRYDVPDTAQPGKFIQRYWDPSHTPVLDENGDISYIVQLATNVTDKIMAEQAVLKSYEEQMATTDRVHALNKELLAANTELRETQQQLSLLNQNLEQRVKKRTRELSEAYERQAAVNEELSVTNEELRETQKRLEQANREMATGVARFRMAVESTGLGTWEYLPVTGQLYWSKECRDIFGIGEMRLVSFETYTQHIHPDDVGWVSARIAECLRPGSAGRYAVMHRIIRADNQEVRWLNAQGTVEFESGTATRFLGTVLDITELKEVEEKSARLAAIITSSNDAIVSKTLDGVITTWNDAAQRLFGYTAEQIIGEPVYKLIPQDRYNEEAMILSRLRNGERLEHYETVRQTRDGRLIDVSLTISPIRDSRGNIIGASQIARDISEQKRDEQRKNDFIGMVSHELKTPLTSLTAILQVLQAKMSKSEETFMPGALERANVQVKKMAKLINGFLNISRLESGKLMIVKEKFKLDELMREIISETELTLIQHVIHFDACDDAPVYADRDKIGSVISNLLSNAIKYSPGSKIIDVRCRVKGDKAVVSVQDYGMGVKRNERNKLFDRYYRVPSSSANLISGFGIGLYLSAEIIRHHDGEIWMDSEYGHGSTFYFSLPLDAG